MKMPALLLLLSLLGCASAQVTSAGAGARGARLATTLARLQRVLLRLGSKQLIVVDTSRDPTRGAVSQQNSSSVGSSKANLMTTDDNKNLVTAAAPVPRICDSILAKNATKLSTGYYLIFNQKVPQAAAQKLCAENGMSLLALETDQEVAAVTAYLSAVQPKKIGTDMFVLWTSAMDLNPDSRFRWNGTGLEVVKKLWHVNEPNGRTRNEHCVTVGRNLFAKADVFKLVDDGCDKHYFFACELAASTCAP